MFVDPDAAASLLRERIYATLTGLSPFDLLGFAETTSAGSAATSLAVTMCGLFAASVVTDFVARSAMHSDAPNKSQWRHIAAVAGQTVETAVFPASWSSLWQARGSGRCGQGWSSLHQDLR